MFVDHLDQTQYIVATYYLKSSTTLKNAAAAIAIGQSIGHPTERNNWETDNIITKHCCKVLNASQLEKSEGTVEIGFPLININLANGDGIAQLLANVMGGHLEIDIIQHCRLVSISIPKLKCFKGPRYGITGLRAYTTVKSDPLIGGIIKPKIGMNPRTIVQMVSEMVAGGINFIMEDEIMSSPSFCTLKARAPTILKCLQGTNVLYSFNVTGESQTVFDRINQVVDMGGSAVHVNWWGGLSIYQEIRRLNLPIFLFYQKSGSSIITSQRNAYSISENALFYLVSLMGADIVHAGMWGGYLNESPAHMSVKLHNLRSHNVMPTLSCGMHPGLIRIITKRFGNDYMAVAGGAIHAHPDGTKAGVLAFKQAIEMVDGSEYIKAVEKWGEMK